MRQTGRLVERVRRLPPLAVDGAIGAGIFALTGVGQLASHALHPTVLGLYAIASLGVALRRKNLWIGCVLVLLAHVVGLFVTGDFIPLAVMALLYTVAEFRGLGVSLVALIVSFMLPFIGWHQVFYRHWGWLDVSIFGQSIYPYLAMVWFAGRAQARRRDIAAQLERRVAQLREERARLSQAAIDAERSRIARDLHALVVRGVQRMNAETRSARELLGAGSAERPDSVGAIESTGRATLADMRRLLVVLRTRDGPAAPPLDVEQRSGQLSASSEGDGQTAGVTRATPAPSSADEALSTHARRLIAIPWVADSLLVLALAALAATEPFLVPITAFSVPVWPFAPVASIAIGVLLLRRRFPLTVLACLAIVAFAYYAFFDFNQAPLYTVDRSVFLAVFTVSAFRGLPWGIGAVGVVAIAYTPQILTGDGSIFSPVDLAFWIAVYLFAVAGGLGARNARRLNAELQDQTELLRRTREERIRLAVAEERTRVARDLHDVVAHGVTVMVVQAGAARALANREPARAREALAVVEQMGQEALRELDTLLGHLGLGFVDTANPLLEPEDRAVRSLVDQVVEAGLRVELLIEGEPGLLDAGLELAIYRIIQEALTNIRKHAVGARAWVEVRYSAGAVEIEVTDTGQASGASSSGVPGAGQGLVGIAERAALFGGEAKAGRTAGGGFRVRARLRRESVLV